MEVGNWELWLEGGNREYGMGVKELRMGSFKVVGGWGFRRWVWDDGRQRLSEHAKKQQS